MSPMLPTLTSFWGQRWTWMRCHALGWWPPLWRRWDHRRKQKTLWMSSFQKGSLSTLHEATLSSLLDSSFVKVRERESLIQYVSTCTVCWLYLHWEPAVHFDWQLGDVIDLLALWDQIKSNGISWLALQAPQDICHTLQNMITQLVNQTASWLHVHVILLSLVSNCVCGTVLISRATCTM